MTITSKPYSTLRRRLGRGVSHLAIGVALCHVGMAAYAQGTPGGDSTFTLPSVAVEGQNQTETASGPVIGYVAKRSEAGTKTDTPLIETPQSISVIPQDQLVQQDAQTLNQALHYTAGVITETRGGIATRYDQLTIRGFDADKYLNGLKLIGNGFYIIPQIDPFLLERIDVLKGPSSILYGQANAGGLIDQILKRPPAVAYHEVGLEFGSDGHYQGTFDFGGPIDKDGHWLYRITGLGRTEDGQISQTKNERLALAPSLTWKPDVDTALTLNGLYQHDPRSTSYGGVPPVGSVLPNPLGQLPRNFYDGDKNFEKFDRTEISLGYDFSKRLDDIWTVRSKAQWFHTNQDYASVYENGLESDNHTLDRGTAASRESADQFTTDNTVEAHLQTGPVRHTVLVGFDYQHLSSQWYAGFGTAPSLDILAPNYNQVIAQPTRTLTKAYLNQFGIYAQEQAKLGGLVLTLSGRRDWAETYQSNATYNTRDHQQDSAFTGRAGLTYVFANGIAPYVSYAESFNPILGNNATGSGFKPESGQQYEVGVKYQPPGTKTLLTLAAFDLIRQNLVTPDLANPLLSIQSGEARSRGVEAEARTSLNSQLDVVAAYTYLDTVYTQDNSGLQGKRLPAIPQHAASGWAYYTMPEGPFDGLSFGGGARYIGTTFNTLNTFKVESSVLVDSVVSYDMGAKLPRAKGLTLYVNTRNLLDKTYVASCYYGDFCAYGYGRQIFGGLRYRW